MSQELKEKPPFFVALDLLCELLNRHISEAKKDLVKSSVSSPMYGIIQSIHAAYESAGAAAFMEHSHHHREAMVAVISICDNVASLVSPVVCSSSPEGFLPEGEPLLEEDQLSQEVLDTSQPASLGNTQSVSVGNAESALLRNAESAQRETIQSAQPLQGNAQSLLLCCWHSMKEIALLLGYLTENAPVIGDLMSTDQMQKGIITHKQVSISILELGKGK